MPQQLAEVGQLIGGEVQLGWGLGMGICMGYIGFRSRIQWIYMISYIFHPKFHPKFHPEFVACVAQLDLMTR